MSEARAPTFRLALGVAVAVLGFVEIQNAVFTLRSPGRLRDRVARSIEADLLRVRGRLSSVLAPGGNAGWSVAMSIAISSVEGAIEAEVFDLNGRRLSASPGASPVSHWPTAFQMAALKPGLSVTVGPVAGKGSRFLTYTSFPSGAGTVVLRLASEAPDVVRDLTERRQLLLGHGLALIALVVLAGLALMPARGGHEAGGAVFADAYAAAMERLRDHGAFLAQTHEAEIHRMEDQVRDKEAMARAGELTAGMAHEVRNGLGTILGYARLIERGTTPEDVSDAARQIREECETLETVVRRFMEFVKRETLTLAPFDLSRMLSRVVARESRGRLEPEVQVIAADVGLVTADEGLLERAFENLVRNALEAAGPRGHVWIKAQRGDGEVEVVIEDDGPGYAGLPDGPRPFFTTKAGGVGLGLPLALKIVRLHGGGLELAAREPQGLAVRVSLPESSMVDGLGAGVTDGSGGAVRKGG